MSQEIGQLHLNCVGVQLGGSLQGYTIRAHPRLLIVSENIFDPNFSCMLTFVKDEEADQSEHKFQLWIFCGSISMLVTDVRYH